MTDTKMTDEKPPIMLSDRLRNLIALAPDDFFQETLNGAASVIEDISNPLRLNLFSTAIRMLFEHIMGTLAPDADVEACAWYAPLPDQTKPVRAQRIQYWLQGGLEDKWLENELGIDAKELRQRLLKAFNELSKHVHGRAQTVIRDPRKQEVEAASTITAVESLLHSYHDCRAALVEPLVEKLDDAAIDELLSKTIDAIDQLATHHTIDEICTELTDVALIGSNFVRYRASGTISVTLQWGSNSDMQRGDGVEFQKGFPFDCLFQVPLSAPDNLDLAEVVSLVDTDDWYGDRYGNDNYD